MVSPLPFEPPLGTNPDWAMLALATQLGVPFDMYDRSADGALANFVEQQRRRREPLGRADGRERVVEVGGGVLGVGAHGAGAWGGPSAAEGLAALANRGLAPAAGACDRSTPWTRPGRVSSSSRPCPW